jgi:ribosomal protein L32
MPRYDIRNDGAGAYAIFYCDTCGREFRSQPDVANTLAQDFGRNALSGLLRKVPLVGGAAADSLMGQDARYSYKMDAAQLDHAWKQVQEHFRECPTCQRIVCLSDFDTQSGFCQEDSPRQKDIAEARGEQAGAALKGLASAFGLGDAFKQAAENAQRASAASASTQMTRCPKCGEDTHGAKFCPNCGARQEAPAAVATANKCAQCGAETQGAKFCPECGAKQA